jgi:DNA-binding transcriptional LysR family regulator
MNLQNLRVFLKVAEYEHITRASEELNLTQPAVTKIIQSLEQEVHLDLIERQGRRIVLTQAGRVLQGYARKLFALEREMEDALIMLHDVEIGEVKLAANTTVGVYLLPPIVARFHMRYPRVALDIAILNSQAVIERTLDYALDFGLIEGDASHLPDALSVRFFARDTLVLVASPGHHWYNQDFVISDTVLADGELLMRERGSGIREAIQYEFEHRGLQLRPLLTLPNNEAIKQMVISGVGATIVSRHSVQRELTNGDLVQLPMDLDLHPQLSFIQRTDKQLSLAAQAFYTFLFPPNTES